MTASSKVHKVKTRSKRSLEDLDQEFLAATKTKGIAAMEYGKKMKKRL